VLYVQRNALPKKGGENGNVMEIVYIVFGLTLTIIDVIAALKRGRGITTFYPTQQPVESTRFVGLADPSIASSMYNTSVYNAFSHRDNPPPGFR
jgi:hypothetical protein